MTKHKKPRKQQNTTRTQLVLSAHKRPLSYHRGTHNTVC